MVIERKHFVPGHSIDNGSRSRGVWPTILPIIATISSDDRVTEVIHEASEIGSTRPEPHQAAPGIPAFFFVKIPEFSWNAWHIHHNHFHTLTC